MASSRADVAAAQRREAVRVAAGHIGCQIWILGEGACDCVPMRVDNLSADGILLWGDPPVAPRETVRCQLVPAEGDYLSLWARVVRADGRQVALEFVLNEETKRDRVHRWVVDELARLRRL